MVTQGRLFRQVLIVLLTLTTLVTVAYASLSVYVATKLVYVPPTPLYATPSSLGLAYKDVTFPSRGDHVQLRGWFIPGVLSNGQLTAKRTIVFVHGTRTNRADKFAGLLQLSAAFARSGFGVLAFDMRGFGESPSAPLSLGYFEQRDVLGAVDFLQSGPLPYPQLGRPQHLVGWGVSMGASTLLLAAAQAPAIEAVVSDSAYADILPILEREIPKQGHVPSLFTPGALVAAQTLYGIDFYHVQPLDIVAKIAPRPILFIHGTADTYIPPSNMQTLAATARSAPNAHVQTWLISGTTHAHAFLALGQAYVSRVVDFYTQVVGPDPGAKQ